MTKNLHNAGFQIIGNDIVQEKCNVLSNIGANATLDTNKVVKECEIIMTSLRSSDVFLQVAEQFFVPNVEEGKIFIDLGTTEVRETRELAESLANQGGILIDAPVSGGPHGAETGTLRMFVGGDEQTVEKCKPILEVLGDPKYIVYCGQSGSGQIVKGVNQLVMGLSAAAYMEAMAFGVCAGVDPKAIRQAVGADSGWRGEFDRIANRIVEGNGKTLVVKYPELPYFLNEAEESGFEIPLTAALHEFCKKGSYEMLDNMKRPSRFFWHELTKNF